MTQKTQVVTYMRVTNQKQVREDYSLEQQQKILRDYANKNNLKIVAEFTDSELVGWAYSPTINRTLQDYQKSLISAIHRLI